VNAAARSRCASMRGRTGRDRYLSKTIKGTEEAAQKRAQKALTQLQADVDNQRAPESSVPLSHALDEWLRTVEIEDTTRRTYVGYIDRTIKPALGTVAVVKLSAWNLETLYAELRRCRALQVVSADTGSRARSSRRHGRDYMSTMATPRRSAGLS
jgi:hypothetical protein